MMERLSIRVGALLLASLATSGCINLAPDHVQPDLSSAPDYDAEYHPQGAVDPTKLDWQGYFADSRLKALIDTALDNNRDLMVATARIEQARARYRIQKSERLPTLDASASATRSRSNGNAAGPGDTDEPREANRFDTGVAITVFELDFWGRIANLSEAARTEYLATVAAHRAFRLSLIGEVAATYFALIEAEEQLALAEATVSSRSEGLRIAKLRLDTGVTSALPYRQAETLLTQAEQQVASQKLAAAQARNQLALLVGGRLPAELPPGLALGLQGLAQPLDAGLPSRLLLYRPDIIAAEERLRGARARIGAARAAFFPTISLTGTAGFASSELDKLFDNGGFAWSMGPTLRLPIFDWGAREADLDLARALEVEAVADYDRTVQQAFREVSDALAGRRWLADQVAVRQRAVAAQQALTRLAQLRYHEGVVSYLEVLDAERNLFAAQQDLLRSRRLEFQNAVSLYIALGGAL